jgi:hypothetical protein
MVWYDGFMKEYQTLIGLLAISLAIYLGLTTSHGNIVNVSAKTELDSCFEYTLKYTSMTEKELWTLCIAAYSKS